MQKTITTVLVGLIFATQMVAQQKPNEKQNELNGPVKDVRAEYVNYEYKAGEWVNGITEVTITAYSPEKRINRHFKQFSSGSSEALFFYNNEGNLIEVKNYKSIPGVTERSVYTYDKEGRLTSMTHYGADGGIFATRQIKYHDKNKRTEEVSSEKGSTPFRWLNTLNEKGDLLETTSYIGDEAFKKITYSYDVAGKLSQMLVYRLSGKPLLEDVRSYDTSGNMTDRSIYAGDGSVELKEVSRYDDRGNVVEDIYYRGNGELVSKTTSSYEYDQFGNWTRKEDVTVLRDNQPTFKKVATRTITYYQRADSTPQAGEAKQPNMRKPRLLNNPKANYTDEAARKGIEGVVRLRVMVGPDGQVRQVKLISGLPDGLNEEAIRAAYYMKFEPATLDGKPTAYWMPVEVEFKR